MAAPAISRTETRKSARPSNTGFEDRSRPKIYTIARRRATARSCAMHLFQTPR